MLEKIVVDASALACSFSEQRPPELFRRLVTSTPVAPEIIDLEILHTLRRLARNDPSLLEPIERNVDALPDLAIVRVTHRTLIKRVWELRHSITAYDASYVALAEELDVPLVTCDAKLASSNSHHAKIELYSN